MECGMNRRNQVSPHLSLRYVAQGAASQARFKQLIAGVNGQKYQFRCTSPSTQLPSTRDPVQFWHGYVSNDYVRVQSQCFGDQLFAVAGSAHDVESCLQKGDYVLQNQRVVVSHNNARASRAEFFVPVGSCMHQAPT